MIIDTDAGGDDALAIMLALMYEAKTNDIEILAITATYGNTYLRNVEQNVLKILTIANRSDIPVYSGAQKPLINMYVSNDYFGKDGFGDFNFTKNITAKVDKSKHASVLLVELVKQYPGEISIVTIGPLTTIATAIALEPNFLHLVKRHVIMGSSVDSNKIEFNFKQDPESNWIALNNTNKPSIILPSDTVYANLISKEEYRNIYSNLDASIASFLYQAERIALEKTEMWEPADGIAMASVLQPEIITERYKTNLRAVIVGDARGSVVKDVCDQVCNAEIIKNVNITAFKNLLLEYLS
ncbi:pyrimidine-specific ribonucleoside hydrolase riha-like protein [Lasius niger]|uniref:Pyrimidine-specific ribonucleoside hydrolase riha-like protein n=1 Tax=Lasius niger TaxID=67767 RepID=A0A0J7KX96_LASNI|nr:pyrimidine-specific ribonucleoside hydrolase riha-like protein [Lasius niger]